MKTRLVCIALSMFFTLTACKHGDNLTRIAAIADIDNKVLSSNYTFQARSALPMSGRNINLTSPYSLTVKSDSIIAFLPYFGRAYNAPSPTDEGGVKFTSTNFDYKISEKEKGMYKISIETNDNRNKYRLSLLISETGSATLYVGQMDKQSITFHGIIE